MPLSKWRVMFTVPGGTYISCKPKQSKLFSRFYNDYKCCPFVFRVIFFNFIGEPDVQNRAAASKIDMTFVSGVSMEHFEFHPIFLFPYS